MDQTHGCPLGFWGLLGVTALALVISLIMNIFYCISTNQKAPRLRNQSVNQLQRGHPTQHLPQHSPQGWLPPKSSPNINHQPAHPVNFNSSMIQEEDDYPIYGNLTQDNAIESEDCYESMTPANRSEDEIKVVTEHQMCYASLDLSDEQKKRRRKMEQKMNNEKPDIDGNLRTLTSQPSLYLNSDQINFNEGRKEEDIHNDSIFYGKINTSHSKLSINTARAFDSASDF
ncbi:T-cell receptor-associated transmembrane adapter 1-like isoform X1 [Mobula birostris]|uniref:T-cell receptor-associated transmembrane adapter 1-like isoform X1 n=1 Tax=Mobula birostris TaxID=1983395 RepID=UPI003B287FA8